MLQEIDVNLIFHSRHARRIEKARVKELAESMGGDVGLIHAICVRPSIHHRGTTPFDAFDVVAGHHRLEAAHALGWPTIRCVVVEFDDLRAELAEIDEKLIRAPLSPSQEAEAIFRRKAIYEELHPETKAGANIGPERQFVATGTLSFSSSTAEATGKDRRTIERAAARGEALGQDLQEIVGTSLDGLGGGEDAALRVTTQILVFPWLSVRPRVGERQKRHCRLYGGV